MWQWEKTADRALCQLTNECLILLFLEMKYA